MKEKMKSILFVLAFALVFVGAMKVTEASAAGEAKEEKVIINYFDEMVGIEATSGSVYYQVVTKTDLSRVNEKNWIKAAKSGDRAWIDFSALSNTKEGYIVYTDNAKAKGSDLTAEKNLIAIPARVKSFKATFKYETEEVTSGGIYDIIAKLDVKGTKSGKAEDFIWPTDEDLKNKKLNEVVDLGWKRGANGNWYKPGAFDTLEWEMMKASNSTLYLRIEAADMDNDGTKEVFRYSKEAKIKVPKTAKAPSIKVDYTKNTVGIKSGMEFRVAGSEDAWIKVASKISGSTGTNVYDVETGLAKAVSSLTLKQLGEKITVASGNAVSIEVRTAATSSKFASNIAIVDFTAPAAAPVAKTDAATKVMTYTAASGAQRAVLILELSKAVEGIDATYEYALVGEGYDPANVKFTPLTETTVTKIDLSSKVKTDANAKVSYKTGAGSKDKADVAYLEAMIIVRKKANKTEKLFASQILEIKPQISK